MCSTLQANICELLIVFVLGYYILCSCTGSVANYVVVTAVHRMHGIVLKR